MSAKNRRGRRRLFQVGDTVQPMLAFSDSVGLGNEYHRLTIMPLSSKPKRSASVWMTLVLLIGFVATAILVLAR
jgi:hypothetical protein